MSETSGDRVPIRVPADDDAHVTSEVASDSLSTVGPRAEVSVDGGDTIARLREDADRLAVRCMGVERLLTNGPTRASDWSNARNLLTATRDVRCACHHLLAVLGAEMPNGSTSEATRRRVLVVDDVADAIEMVAAILEAAGFEVTTATNGLEGLVAAHRSLPTVILMDLQMPVLDGIEATRLLKAATATRHIPVIAHTARPDSCPVPPGALFAHVLTKPVVPDVLLGLIERVARE